jgi:hypothetical protein
LALAREISRYGDNKIFVNIDGTRSWSKAFCGQATLCIVRFGRRCGSNATTERIDGGLRSASADPSDFRSILTKPV